MKYLLDSHLLIWALFTDEKLPHKIYTLINDPKNDIYYSAASVGKLELKQIPEKNTDTNDLQFAPVESTVSTGAKVSFKYTFLQTTAPYSGLSYHGNDTNGQRI